jgi:hypothetical protein
VIHIGAELLETRSWQARAVRGLCRGFVAGMPSGISVELTIPKLKGRITAVEGGFEREQRLDISKYCF